MTDATHFFLQQQLNRLASDCSSARTRIRAATSMRNVKHASSVQANAMIRAFPQTRQELRSVLDYAEKRMGELLDQQLKALANIESSDQMRTEYGRLVRTEWCFLRGDFGRVFTFADRRYQQLVHAFVHREEHAAENQAEPDDESLSPAP